LSGGRRGLTEVSAVFVVVVAVLVAVLVVLVVSVIVEWVR
jgi:hypothetical protein